MTTFGYCAKCKHTLTVSEMYDDDLAYCPACKRYVAKSFFEVPSWIMGVLVLLTSIAILPPV